MNREIKFRGLNTSGQWRFGYLCHNGQFPYIQSGITSQGVKEETVGQFTGLLDKSDKEIYEGDIIKHTRGNCEVYFHHGAFVITYPETKQWHLLNYGGAGNLEIIGNIYENPDLLTKHN